MINKFIDGVTPLSKATLDPIIEKLNSIPDESVYVYRVTTAVSNISSVAGANVGDLLISGDATSRNILGQTVASAGACVRITSATTGEILSNISAHASTRVIENIPGINGKLFIKTVTTAWTTAANQTTNFPGNQAGDYVFNAAGSASSIFGNSLASGGLVYITKGSSTTPTSIVGVGELRSYINGGGAVTRVKGDSESTYRSGNVNLTAANIGAQATLVSGTNIKTLNSQSLLGSGDISISGGGAQGTLWFSVTEATSTAPIGARIGDYVINGGMDALIIGTRSLSIGDYRAITAISPSLVLESVLAGNIRGPEGGGGGAVTGVKGNNESTYRTDNVNLTAANIGAQTTLVSGTNIKTINNQSLLGSGDIPIPGISDIGKVLYPVGAIFMSTVNTNPGTYITGTTWVAWGSGRVPVGINTSDTAFNTVEKTGGNKNAVNVSHTHTTATESAHTHTAASAGGHSHDVWTYRSTGNTYNNGGINHGNSSKTETPSVTTGFTTSAGAHTHATNGGSAHSHTVNSAGEVATDKNLQPYITCYMWKRTA